MRKLAVLLLGIALMGGAVGMFGYRWVYKTERSVRAPFAAPTAPGAPSDARVKALPDRKSDGRPGTPSQGGGEGWKSLEVVLNALNALCGIMGVWMAWLGLRMQRTMAAMQADRERDRG